MRYQVWHATVENETPVGEPWSDKAEALAHANDLNSKPVDGGLYVVKAVPVTDDLLDTANKLISLLGDKFATEDIDKAPLNIMSDNTLASMRSLISRLECDRGFNSSGFASLTEGQSDG